MADAEVSKVDVSQLIADVTEYQKHAFLTGAGTSKQAGIPTSGELIEEWQTERYEQAETDKERDAWIETAEEEIGAEQSEYGFWFEQCHPKEVHRRKYIQELVDDVDPTLHHLVLAKMMSESYIPHVLTPNFDDLLFDAFYLYLEDKPNVLAHQALAPEFRLTNDDSTIVKLHGDYLYNNLKNTDSETDNLAPTMRKVVKQTVEEYGLVVVGYSGGDESIMEPLRNAELSQYGIYWCVRSADNLRPEVEELLQQPNVDLVEIESFGSLMAKFEEEIPDVELPAPSDIVDRAEERAEKLRGTVADGDNKATSEEEEELRERTSKRWAATEEYDDGNYARALALINDVIDDKPDDAVAYSIRGMTKQELGQNEGAINDYTQAIELNPDHAVAYYNRGNAKKELGWYEEAIDDYTRAIERNLDKADAYTNRGNAKYKLGRYEEAIDDHTQAIELDPDFAPAYSNRGNVKDKLGRYEEAIDDHTQAIELDPDFAPAYSNRGNVKAELGRYEDAIEDHTQAIEITSESVIALQNRAEMRIITGKYNLALDDASEAKAHSDSTYRQTMSVFLELIAKILHDEDATSEREEYQNLCEKEFTTDWDFEHLDSWLVDANLDTEKREEIEELIELLREHKPDS